MAEAILPRCPFCKQREAKEVFARYVYPKSPQIWPGKPLGIHRLYLCACGQKFSKKLRLRGALQLMDPAAEAPESNGHAKANENGSAKTRGNRTQQNDEG